MTAARRLAAILAAGVGVREHRDGMSEYHAKGSFTPGNPRGPQAGYGAARGGRAGRKVGARATTDPTGRLGRPARLRCRGKRPFKGPWSMSQMSEPYGGPMRKN